MKRDMQKEKT